MSGFIDTAPAQDWPKKTWDLPTDPEWFVHTVLSDVDPKSALETWFALPVWNVAPPEIVHRAHQMAEVFGAQITTA